ncbi:MAG: Apolipoprotein N-acyltransferase [Chlamydiia bacterium]|nr:Apolipoprotein N-acyltransferase [Chlamydiia bacterium]
MVGELLLSHHYTAQGAALLGVFGLSFWVFFTNFCFVHFIKKMNAKRAALWMMAIILPWVYGYYWTHANHATGGDDFRVAVVQTGWLAEEKHEFPNQADRYMGPLKIWEHLLSLMPTQDKAYDLILLPEATVAFDLNFAAYPIEEIFLMIDRSGIVYSKESIPDLTEPHVEIEEGQIYVSNAFIARWLSNIYQSDLIFGVLEDEGAKTYNAAALVSPGKKGIQVYRKRHLVPMAEYLPFGFLQSYIAKFGIEATFAAGEGAKVLRGKQVYSPSICIEEGYNKLIREGRLQGANILVNCTNDIWFPKTTLPRDHLKQGRLRAIENGCSVVRSCNSGVSSIIDPFGKVHKELSDYHADESLVSGTIEMVISPIAFNTPFLVLGNNGIFLLSIVFVLTYFYKGGMLRRTGTEKAKM